MGRIVVAAAALALAVTATASAQETGAEDEDAARVHFESGRVHFDDGNYEMALREFEASWELSHRPGLLYNLYLTTERLGQLDAAIDYLERYLAEGSPEAERRAPLERRLRNLRERRDAAAAEGTEDSTTAPASSSGGGGDMLPAAIAFAVAGAGLVSFAITGGLALAEDGALGSGCGATRSCTSSDVSTLATLNAVADASWIIAAVAAATGVVLLVTLGLGSGGGESARIVPLASPTFAGLAVEGSL